MGYADYPTKTAADIVRLCRRLDAAQVPPRRTDHNVVTGTWNIRALGALHPTWTEDNGSPKRNLRRAAVIAEIISRYSVLVVALCDWTDPRDAEAEAGNPPISKELATHG